MKRGLRMLAAWLALLALGGCAAGEGPAKAAGSAVELFAVNVGKGDALLLRAGDYACLIDAGKAWAMGRVRSAMARMGVERLDAVFVTHTDDDHTGGLDWLAASDIPVGAWYASAMYTGVKEKKHPVAQAAAARGQAVQWLRRGDAVPMGDSGATLEVLAPDSLFEDKDDNNSLVMMLESPAGRMLLAGDMELPEEAELLSQGDDLGCAVLKVANHGDDDTTSAAFAKAASAQLAVISTDSQEKPDTPDPGVVSRLQAAGSQVIVTEDSGLGLAVTLSGGSVAWEAADIGAAPVSGLAIAEVDPEDDRITLANSSGEELSLEGFYLHSERGNELFAFPDGTALAPGATLTVGTYSTEGGCDLLWEDKKVVHKKKTDMFRLYDPWGRVVDAMDNGL